MENKKDKKNSQPHHCGLMRNRSGAVPIDFLVLFIISIAGFIVALILIFRIDLGIVGDKQVCHTSVVFKSTPVLKYIGNFKCKTNYLCISGGGECEGIVPTTTVKVNPSNKEEIMKVIADEMADCWWQFGEGKLDYTGIALKYTVCSICAIVEFDKTIREKIPSGITYGKAWDYLSSTKMKDNKQTYMQYLYGVDNRNELLNTFKSAKAYEDVTIFPAKKYAVITGRVAIEIPYLISRDMYLLPALSEISEVSKVGCEEFLTKAS